MNYFLFAPVTDAQRQRDALLGALVGLARSTDRKSTRLNSSHTTVSRMPSSA